MSCYFVRPTLHLHLVISIGPAGCKATRELIYGDELNMIPVGLAIGGHKTWKQVACTDSNGASGMGLPCLGVGQELGAGGWNLASLT